MPDTKWRLRDHRWLLQVRRRRGLLPIAQLHDACPEIADRSEKLKARGAPFAWIGLRSVGLSVVWKWLDGTDVSASFWADEEPSGDGMFGSGTRTGFNDIAGLSFLAALCEKGPAIQTTHQPSSATTTAKATSATTDGGSTLTVTPDTKVLFYIVGTCLITGVFIKFSELPSGQSLICYRHLADEWRQLAT